MSSKYKFLAIGLFLCLIIWEIAAYFSVAKVRQVHEHPQAGGDMQLAEAMITPEETVQEAQESQRFKEVLNSVEVVEYHEDSGNTQSHAQEAVVSETLLFEEEISDTLRRQVFHQARDGFGSRVRVEQVLEYSEETDSWHVKSSNSMEANAVLVKWSGNRENVSIPIGVAHTMTRISPTSQWYRLEFAVSDKRDVMAEVLSRLSEIGIEAEANYVLKGASLFSNDPLFQDNQQPYLDGVSQVFDGEIGISGLWDLQTDASSAVVAVLDTGIRKSHQDLSSSLWVNASEIPGDGLDNDGNGYIDDVNGYSTVTNSSDIDDLNGHGTHLAGIVGASGNDGVGMAGVAWRSNLMTVQVLNANASGFTSNVIAGIDYAVANGADVMLLAWGTTTHTEVLKDSLRAAQDSGVVWVVPAGNSGLNLSDAPYYPAVYDFENQITVAAHDVRGSITKFSNWGASDVHVSAPGSDILSAGIASDSDYVRMSGTSQSAAIVAGLLAHIKTQHPLEPGWKSVGRVLASCQFRPYTTFGIYGYDLVQVGRVDASKLPLLESSPVPYNDNFENAGVSRQPYIKWTQNLSYATVESAETTHAGSPAVATVWYRWSPSVEGEVTINMEGSECDASVSVYTGSLYSLTEVASNDTVGGVSQVVFSADKGKYYYIAIDAPRGDLGSVTSNLYLKPINNAAAPENVISIAGLESFTEGAHWGGSIPRLDGVINTSTSVWYKWTAPQNGELEFSITSEVVPHMNIYADAGGVPGATLSSASGNSISRSLTSTIPVSNSATYYFEIYGKEGGSGNFVIDINYAYAPISAIITTGFPYSRSPTWGSEMILYGYPSGGTTPLKYQWFLDGVAITGKSTKRGVRIYPLTENHSGVYTVKVSNEYGSVISEEHPVDVYTPPPKINYVRPEQRTVEVGSSAFFEAHVTTTLIESTKEWYHNGVLILGDGSRSLTLSNLSKSDSGIIQLKVTNPFGVAWSNEIQLSVVDNTLVEWENRLPNRIGAVLLNQVYFVNGRFFMTGNDGKIYSSANGESWIRCAVEVESPVVSDFETTGICFGNGVFVAVGKNDGKYASAVSTDGVRWVLGENGNTAYGYEGLMFGNGKFVTIRDGSIYTSSDGISWANSGYSFPVRISRRDMAFGNGVFVISWSSNHYISTDGVNWTAYAGGVDEPASTGSLFFEDGWFYKVAKIGTPRFLFRSSDAISWEKLTLTGSYTLQDDHGLTYDGQNFMVPGSTNTNIMYSNDGGQTFATHTVNLSGSYASGIINDIASGNGKIVAVGGNGFVLTAESLDTLTFSEPRISQNFIQIEDLGNVVVALGEYSTGYVWSYNGRDWQSNTQAFEDITRFGHYYYGSDKSTRRLMYSPNLKEWFTVDSLSSEEVEYVVSGSDRLVVMLRDSRVAMSQDAVNWTISPSPILISPNKLEYVNGKFFLLGGTESAISNDGVNWTTISLGDASPDIIYANGKYIYTKRVTNELFSSTDGVNWSSFAPGVGMGFSFLSTNGTEILGGTYNRFGYSHNAVSWVEMDPSSTSLNDIAHFKGSWIVVGDGGLIMQSGEALSNPQLDILLDASIEQVWVGDTLPVSYAAESAGATTKTVSLIVNGEVVDQSSSGADLNWDTSLPGSHTVWLEMEDDLGRIVTSDVLNIEVKLSRLYRVSVPSFGDIVDMYADDNGVWVITSQAEIFMREAGSSQWQLLETPYVEGLNGFFKMNDGRLLAYGAFTDSLGQSRGVILISEDGKSWKTKGGFLDHPVLAMTGFPSGIIASLDDGSSTTPLVLNVDIDANEWEEVNNSHDIDMLYTWQDMLFAKDNYGNVLRSDDGGRNWSTDYDSSAVDTREFQFVSTGSKLFFTGRIATYVKESLAGSWVEDHAVNNVFMAEEGLHAIESSTGKVVVQELDGTWTLVDRYARPSSFTADYETEVATLGDMHYMRAHNGGFYQSVGGQSFSSIPSDVLPAFDVVMIGEVPFMRNSSGKFTPLEKITNWESESIGNGSYNSMVDFATDGTTALFVDGSEIYQHESEDTWGALGFQAASQTILSLAYSNGRFWAVGYKFARYSDDGTNWVDITADIPDTYGRYEQVEVYADKVCIRTSSKVFISLDKGATWSGGDLAASDAFVDYEGRLYFVYNNAWYEYVDWAFLTRLGNERCISYAKTATLEARAYRMINDPYLQVKASSGDWSRIHHDVSTLYTRLFVRGDRIFVENEGDVFALVASNVKLSLDALPVLEPGVGEFVETTLTFASNGYQDLDAQGIILDGYLMPVDTSAGLPVVRLGVSRVELPLITIGSSHQMTKRWRIPVDIEATDYHLEVFARDIRDGVTHDNYSRDTVNTFSFIPRTIGFNIAGSGQVQIVNPRNIYPNKYPLEYLLIPDSGFTATVASSSNEYGQAVLITSILDDNHIIDVTFQPMFKGWAASTFSGVQDDSSAGDPDNDGVSNVFEYLMGTDPLTPDAGLSIGSLNKTATGFSFEFTLKTNRLYEDFYVEVSNDMVNWERIPHFIVNEDSVNTTFGAVAPDNFTDRAFFRLKYID